MTTQRELASARAPHTTLARTHGAQRLLKGPGTPLHSSQIPRLLDRSRDSAHPRRPLLDTEAPCGGLSPSTAPSSSPVSCHQHPRASRAHSTARDLPMWAPCISTPCDFCSAIAILNSLLSRPGMFGIFLAGLALSFFFASGFCAAGATRAGKAGHPLAGGLSR